MISVVIPLYNKEKYIKRAIESVLNQTFQKFEIIVVNDGSTDKSAEIVQNIKDPRIRLVNQKNAGVSAARNKGIQEAKYEYISFLDADDFWEKNFLETLWNLKNKYPKCGVFATSYKFLYSDGTVGFPIIKGLKENFEGIIDDYFKIALQSDPLIWTSAVMVKKYCLKKIGGFPVGIRAGEDLLTWARLAVNCKIAYSYKYLAVFCKENTSNIRTPDFSNYVSDELINLLKGFPNNYLKNYIAYWHKIRMNNFIRLGYKKEAQKEFKRMIQFSDKKISIKFFIYYFLLFLPSFVSKNLLIFIMNKRKRKK